MLTRRTTFKGLGKYPKFKAKRRYSGWTYPNKQRWKALSNGLNLCSS